MGGAAAGGEAGLGGPLAVGVASKAGMSLQLWVGVPAERTDPVYMVVHGLKGLLPTLPGWKVGLHKDTFTAGV